jgi:molybdopterin molybdotransferase
MGQAAGECDSSFHDPRMRGFRTRATVEDVVTLIDQRVQRLGIVSVPLNQAHRRILAQDIVARYAVPTFDRAAMDGYALRGEETFGTDFYNPAPFRVIGEASPGARFSGVVGPGQAVRITTGAPIPEGADAVVKAESSACKGETVWVSEATAPGRHLGRAGEDIASGTLVLGDGRRLRPQDLGVLSALGWAAVPVVGRPNVAIVVTGDEILPAGTPPEDCRIADMNSVVITALVERDGGIPQVIGPLPDDRARIRAEITRAVSQSEIILISGGSSTGPEDHAPGVVAELGELPIHGVALRPASPTGLGFIGDVPVDLLPGNPVSCLCAYDFFAGRIVRRLAGRDVCWPYRREVLPLAAKLVSALGRVDYARVRLVHGRVEPLAVSGASILSSTTRAVGFVVVPAGLEGYPEGASVEVWFYDG